MESWQKPRLRYTKRVKEIYQHVKMISPYGYYAIDDYRGLTRQERDAVVTYLEGIGYELSLIDYNGDPLVWHVATPKGKLPPPLPADTLMGRRYTQKNPFETFERIKRTQINNADCLVFKANDNDSFFDFIKRDTVFLETAKFWAYAYIGVFAVSMVLYFLL